MLILTKTELQVEKKNAEEMIYSESVTGGNPNFNT
jgi:hypothetical protein